MQQIIKNLPSSAGVYHYYNQEGRLLYIGKAKNLKNRVKSYWRFTPSFHPNPSLTPRILKMLKESSYLEYLVVPSEEDALILENTLIKQLKPKYNILLRDDKTYPYIYLDNTQRFPRFEITREVIKNKNIFYYGPFPTGGKALFNALYEIYPLVQKKSCLRGKKACLFFQIKKCLAPCEEKVTQESYAKIIQEAKQSIIHPATLIKKLETKMLLYASDERFEDASKLRDSIKAIESLNIHSSIDLAQQTNSDIIAIINAEERGVIVRFFLRDGKVISSSHTFFRHTHYFDNNESYKQSLLNFYTLNTPYIPQEILVAHQFKDIKEISTLLSHQFSKKITVRMPQRGKKFTLIKLAIQNAKELLKNSSNHSLIEQDVAYFFNLSQLPFRVESFDTSHMMGVASVGGMVVWNENQWEKRSYKRYELHHKTEYAQMEEILSRRVEKFKIDPAPDLWIIDGGKANLHLAYRLLKEANITLDVIAIAKEKIDKKAHRAKGLAKDLIYLQDEIFELKPNDKRLQWIQRQRDEAHRYAILYHQNKKRKEDKALSLLSQKGIGKASIQKLLHYFGTFDAIYHASAEEIEQVTNRKIADIIIDKKL